MIFYFCLSIGVFLLLLSYLINKKKSFNFNKSSMFECGFDSFSISRSPFSLHFFKLCMIFIIFDIEIIIILPSPIIFTSSFIFFFSFLLIISIFFLSLIFEWYQNSLNWIN